MKRFLLASIMILMTAVCPAGVFAAENDPAEITAEAPAPETAVLEDLPDSEELFEGYFNAQFYGKKTSARPGMLKAAQRPRRSSLQKYEQVLYDALLAEIKAVAAGEKTSTDFTVKINVPEIAGPFSATDLGVDATVSNGAITAAAANAMYDMRDALINVEAVCDALRIDYPYELYWYDKTVGYYYGGSAVSASWYNGSYHMYYPQPMTYSFSFAVSNDYAAANSTETRQVGEDTITASFRTDSSKTAATKTAAANARAVVNNHAGLHDYDKVTAYKEYICEQVEYNKAAAADSYAGGYGDPWQLVWVFDGNASTNVVCEGYAKAFQYLCDLTAFNAKVECRTVTGIMSGGTGAGGHMWNVLQIGGKNYLVDVTNSDAGTVGANGGLFMVGQSGSTHLSYTFKNVKFEYDEDTVGLYTDDERRLSESDFNRNTYVPDLDLYPGKAAACTEAGVKDYYSYEGSDKWFSAKDEDTLIGNHEDIMIAAAGHTTAEAVRENEVAAACETAGSYESVVYCAVCGQEISRETVSVPASGHEYGAWTVSQEATCDKEGVETRVCAHDPAHVETRKIAKLAHTPAEAVIENTVEATCAEAGSYDNVVYCTKCKQEISRETVPVPAIGHDYSEWTVSQEATCDKEGIETRVCAHDPAHAETRETAKLAHTPGTVTEENRTEATCEADGGYDEVVYCMVCKGELSREHHTITKLSHTPAEAVSENITQPTCTEEGSYDSVVYCSVCHQELKRAPMSLPANGHSPGKTEMENEIQATCKEDGGYDKVIYCTVCREELSRSHVTLAKTSHVSAPAVIEKEVEASCTAAGSNASVIRCLVCKAVLSKTTKTIPASGHKFGSWTYKDASSHSRVCANNSTHVETAAHSWNAGIVTKAPTTAAAGIRTYTCTVCGGTKTESIAKLNAGEPVSPEYAPALEQTEKKVLTMKGDEAPAGSAFGLLKLRAAKTTKKSVKLQWNKVKGASGYVIYGSPCGSKFKKITEIKKGSAKSFTVKKLKKGKYYKFYIVATAEYNGQTKVLAGSKSIHIATAGGKKGNYKTLTLKNVKKNKLTLKVKKKFTVKTKLSAAKGVKVKKHRAVCFESSNPAVAEVTKKGKITAKKAGKCSIFVYAQNGIYKTIKLTVK